VTDQLLHYRRFTDRIPFSELTGLAPLEISNPGGDAYAMGSDQLIFGWLVNADTDMAGKSIAIHGLEGDSYRLKLYQTWSGRFITEDGKEEQIITTDNNSLSFGIPVLKIEGFHAHYIGQDIAFIMEPVE
jgi:hypothetical protein